MVRRLGLNSRTETEQQMQRFQPQLSVWHAVNSSSSEWSSSGEWCTSTTNSMISPALCASAGSLEAQHPR